MARQSEERNKKIQQKALKNWQDPEYRKRMIEAQKKAGLRTYQHD